MFTAAGGIVASHVAKWDGTTWSPLGAGTNGSVYTLAVFDEGSGLALYAGGNFGQAGGVPARQLARWTGSEWRGHGGGVANAAGGGKAYAMKAVGKGAAVDPGLYVGGEFAAAGGVAAGNIARYDDQGWHALGDGVDGEVFALCLFDDLYVGGAFKSAGGRGAAGIARWDGASWAPLGAGSEWAVRAIAVFDDGSGGGPALYASGHFGGAHIARWDGAAWSGIGSVSGGNVNAMAVFNDGSGAALYAAGAFMSVNGVQAGGIARWDGSSWTALGAGFEVELSQQVNALAVYDDGRGAVLYAAGRLLHSGEVAVNGIARWDGASWSSVGGGVIDSKVLSLAVFDDGLEGRPGLYAGGTSKWPAGPGPAWWRVGTGRSGRRLAAASAAGSTRRSTRWRRLTMAPRTARRSLPAAHSRRPAARTP
jgi:hypothetical protein